jgi:hypothetical protein
MFGEMDTSFIWEVIIPWPQVTLMPIRQEFLM